MHLDLQKSYLQNFEVRFDNLTLEANAKQLKIAGVRELGLKSDDLIAVIIFLEPRIGGFLRENHPS